MVPPVAPPAGHLCGEGNRGGSLSQDQHMATHTSYLPPLSSPSGPSGPATKPVRLQG